MKDVETTFITTLTETKDPAIKLMVVRAMRNARLHGTTQSLLHVVKNSTDTAIISAALQAVAAITQDFASIEVSNM